MNPLRIVAIDDEELALRRIRIALREIPDVELVGTARGGREGLELIASLRPDVLLLDVDMPECGGFEVVEGLPPNGSPVVIFVTAFDEHAVRAFQVNATDYLLKPLEFDRLRAAIEKARVTIRQTTAEERAAELTMVLAAVRNSKPAAATPRFESEIWASQGSGFKRLLVSQIDWIEAERDYVRLHVGEKSFLLRETMRRIETRLDPKIFVRVHRSALVSVDRIGSIRAGENGGFCVRMVAGNKIPVGKTYVKFVRRLINGRAGGETARQIS